jgi:aminoglycoside phosphotransferase (APT) family kinase protein
VRVDSLANPPSPEHIRALLDVIEPGSTLAAVHALPGSYSNFTHLVEIKSSAGDVSQIVVRRYADHGDDRSLKAVREFKTLALLQNYPHIPVPQPRYLDMVGSILDAPGIVTSFVTGQQIAAHPESLHWTRVCPTAALMLARIHAVPLDTDAREFLMDGNTEAAWFLRSGTVPAYMRAHPDGARVWQAVHDLRPGLISVEPALIHLDYWSGNILWEGGQITAVVDWEEAAYGDPGIDVAYCRMELFLEGMDAAADTLLQVYEENVGQPVANLGYWELAAAARPMLDLDGWITRPVMADRFRRFIANALQRAGYSG